MDKRCVFIGDNRPEDVRCLNSLSEFELDLLISLKKLALQRAKFVGHESLANKLDLKMLRAVSYALMQHMKGQIKDVQFTGIDRLKEMLDGCNLSKLDLEDISPHPRDEISTPVMHMNKKMRRRTSQASQVVPDSKRKKFDNLLGVVLNFEDLKGRDQAKQSGMTH